jgi:hypothetical protein
MRDFNIFVDDMTDNTRPDAAPAYQVALSPSSRGGGAMGTRAYSSKDASLPIYSSASAKRTGLSSGFLQIRSGIGYGNDSRRNGSFGATGDVGVLCSGLPRLREAVLNPGLALLEEPLFR